MNFFNVFSDDPDPQTPEPSSPPAASSPSHHEHPSSSDPESESKSKSDLTPPHSPPSQSSNAGGLWSLGGLVKTFATRSESVIETYRRDLEEFGVGLKKETQSFRDVATRAMKELPSSIEIKATKAQGAIDSIGSTVWRSTAEILAHGKESLLANDLDNSDDGNGGRRRGSTSSANCVDSGGRYSRFDAQLRAIQCDVNTYAEEPESDGGDYGNWRLGFNLEEKEEEIEGLVSENGAVGEIYNKLVPGSVDRETFWCRYYYRVYRLEQAESMRAKLVRRATSKDAEEELSWDVEDEEEEEEEAKAVGSQKNVAIETLNGNDDKLITADANFEISSRNTQEKSVINAARDEDQMGVDRREEMDHGVVEEAKDENHLPSRVETAVGVEEGEKKSNVVESVNHEEVADKKEVAKDASTESNKDEPTKKPDENLLSDTKAEGKESTKKTESSAVPKPHTEEDDIGWDEIEDLGSGDENKVNPIISHDRTGSSDRTEVRKQLSMSIDDEELSWDIEDDDEPIKG